MKKFIIYLTIFLLPALAGAQQFSRYVIASAGATLSMDRNEYSYTIGESVVASFVSGDGKYFQNQGFQQPASLIINSIDEGNGSKLDVRVYPNPTRDLIYIASGNQSRLPGCHIYLFDMLGHLQTVEVSQVPGNTNRLLIDLTDLAKGAYLLKITDDNNALNTISFRVIKIY